MDTNSDQKSTKNKPTENETPISVLSLEEEKILTFWQENDIFQKSLLKPAPRGDFVFYEGPPTANGKPGIHHLESRAWKDVFLRYRTMRGYHVPRQAGWDTHGLPVELQVEKELGLSSKKEIETWAGTEAESIAAFNEKCRESVGQYMDFWDAFTNRIGYWLDQDHAYVTYKTDYIESVWNIIKHVADQDLLYKDYKVLPWCPRCGTALSSHELAQGYQEDTDISVYVKFRLKTDTQNDSKNDSLTNSLTEVPTFFLAWTTTPWTLPGNVALAVGKDIDYVKVRSVKNSAENSPKNSAENSPENSDETTAENLTETKEEYLWLAKSRLALIPDVEILEEKKGSELAGLEYEPLYPFLADNLPESEIPKLPNAFKVYVADFVNTEDGTGIVHTAVMYGADDFVLGTEVNLPKYHLVLETGYFSEVTGFLANTFVKSEETAVTIIKDLASRSLLFKKEKYKHSYPHCWRCKTSLIYYARDSWYIRMSALRDKLVSENETINWQPEHIKNGRFGEWLKEVKDWAISRERYWGTPLPVWKCNVCDAIKVIGSVAELENDLKKSRNSYFIMRHGITGNNDKGIISYKEQATDHLTEKGIAEVKESAKSFLEELDKRGTLKISDIVIISSTFTRALETTEIVRQELGLAPEAVTFDQRLKEINPGELDGRSWLDYHHHLSEKLGSTWFNENIPGGESLSEVKNRIGAVLDELERTYSNKQILIVTHGGPIWTAFVHAGQYLPMGKDYKKFDESGNVFVPEFPRAHNAEIRALPFIPMPRDNFGRLDLHRPFIDQVQLICSCGGTMERAKEVIDVWFDSGAMPFAKDHYPFENKELIDGVNYPADYICEAVDQTRGWFYTLHAIGVLMGKGKAYKNVISLGHILDSEGKKMSKSLGNIIDPWVMIRKYGVDALRLWMYGVNHPGDSKNFDERTVDEIIKKTFLILGNVWRFYEQYAEVDGDIARARTSKNILDRWIIARLDTLILESTAQMDAYQAFEPSRALREFITDLSTWYLRRSRDRFKGGDSQEEKEDALNALGTTRFVLLQFSKIMAPFAPFFAERLYLGMKSFDDPESVHLADWPEVELIDVSMAESQENNKQILNFMEEARRISTAGLEARQRAGFKVRQPLASVTVLDTALPAEYIVIIQDELNIKEIIFVDPKSTDPNSVDPKKDETSENEKPYAVLDTVITPNLREEGRVREFSRAIQDLRKKAGLELGQEAILVVNLDEQDAKSFVERNTDSIIKNTFLSSIKFSSPEELNDSYAKINLDGFVVNLRLE